jgi:NACHT domain
VGSTRSNRVKESLSGNYGILPLRNGDSMMTELSQMVLSLVGLIFWLSTLLSQVLFARKSRKMSPYEAIQRLIYQQKSVLFSALFSSQVLPRPISVSWRFRRIPPGMEFPTAERLFESDFVRLLKGELSTPIVLLGEAGSGKTTMARQAMLDLLTESSREDNLVDKRRVPLIISLSTWEPSRISLNEWLTKRISQEHGMQSEICLELLLNDNLLLLMDGLDEMPAKCREEALRHLVQKPGFVIISRYKEFFAVANSELISGAIIVEIEPLRVSSIKKILKEDPDFSHPRWQKVLDVLQSDSNESLRSTLSTPLMWSLFRGACQQADFAEELLRIGRTSSVRNLEEWIVRTYLRERVTPQKSHDPAKVLHWLRELANWAKSSPDGRFSADSAWKHVSSSECVAFIAVNSGIVELLTFPRQPISEAPTLFFLGFISGAFGGWILMMLGAQKIPWVASTLIAGIINLAVGLILVQLVFHPQTSVWVVLLYVGIILLLYADRRLLVWAARARLSLAGRIPVRLVSFMEYAAQCGILIPVEQGYRFRHSAILRSIDGDSPFHPVNTATQVLSGSSVNIAQVATGQHISFVVPNQAINNGGQDPEHLQGTTTRVNNIYHMYDSAQREEPEALLLRCLVHSLRTPLAEAEGA